MASLLCLVYDDQYYIKPLRACSQYVSRLWLVYLCVVCDDQYHIKPLGACSKYVRRSRQVLKGWCVNIKICLAV